MIDYMYTKNDRVFFLHGKVFKAMKSVEVSDFYWWLRKEERLTWEMTYLEGSGSIPKQTIGTMSWDEYIEKMPHKEIEKDLEDYCNYLKSKKAA